MNIPAINTKANKALKEVLKPVTPEKTTFVLPSTNLYNFTTITHKKFIGTDGSINDSSTNAISDYITVKPNTVYSVTKAHTVSFFTSDKVFILRQSAGSGFTTPSNAYFLRLTINDNTDVETAQLNEGSTLLPFEKFFYKIDKKLLPDNVDGNEIKKESIPLEKLSFLQGSSNLYNVQTVTRDKNFSSTTGALVDSPANTVSDFIPVTPNTTYTSNLVHTMAFFTQSKTFISRPYNPTGTFTTPSNAYFVRLVINDNDDVQNAQLNKGSVLLPYEPFYVGLAPNSLPYNLRDKATAKSYYFSPETITKPYKSVLNSHSEFSTPDEYYGAFNSLASAYPDYLTEELLGKDESGTYDIYKYTAKPQQISGASDLRKKLPKFVFSIGLHGEEKTSIYAIYYLMKDICENWQNDEALEYLRWNVEFVFIPMGNPWCFANGIRHNVNGVDLNRNFPHQWEPLTGNEYSGTGPASEVETQYVVDMLDQNKDAIFFGDYHTNGSTSNYAGYDKLMWMSLVRFGKKYDDIAITSKYTIEKMTREYIKDYSLPNNVGYFGFITEAIVPGGSKTYGDYLGIPSTTFETFVKLPDETDKYSPQTIKMGTEFLGNLTLNLIKQFRLVY